MFQVRPHDEGHWIIVDDQDRQIYVGSWSQCEDWLDRHENCVGPSNITGFFTRCWNALFSSASNGSTNMTVSPKMDDKLSPDEHLRG